MVPEISLANIVSKRHYDEVLKLEPYLEQNARWPAAGRHVLAHYDDESVVVYQAYRPSIGEYAAAHGYFGGPDFSLSRMSWIKPNFLWMMYRCGWASKEGQEVVLAIRLRRAAFDDVLAQAVPSSFDPADYADEAAWKRDVESSNVRLQWDPDHNPGGTPVTRRAVQLGLRGDVLAKFAREWILEIENVTPFVREQHAKWKAGGNAALVMPSERVYPVRGANKLRADS
jgi:hypothetical protein